MSSPKGPSVLMMEAIEAFVKEHRGGLDQSHIEFTPERVVKALRAKVAGNLEDPKEILGTIFDSKNYDQMVWRRGIRVVSTCAHHLETFIGKATFAYVPGKHIVGISKISRLVRCFSRRLQVQERLTDQIVDAFQDIVKPYGCAVYIRCYHFCEIVRGAEEHAASTETTALRGCFKDNPATRAEFLGMLDKQEQIFP
jgi:GTP cyclohydrolase I